jgi:hypothetical protein
MPYDTYRRYLTMKAGFVKAYHTPKGVFFEPKSIAFSSMDEDTFQGVYSRVLDKVIEDIGATSEEIEKELVNFM